MNAVDLSGLASLDVDSLRDETLTLFCTFLVSRMDRLASSESNDSVEIAASRSQAKTLKCGRELWSGSSNNQMMPSDDWIYRDDNIRIITSCEDGQVTTLIISRDIWSVICSELWSLIELFINEFESFVGHDTATITEIHSDDDSYDVTASALDFSCEAKKATITEIYSDESIVTIESSYIVNESESDSSCYEPSMSPTTLHSKLYELYHKND